MKSVFKFLGIVAMAGSLLTASSCSDDYDDGEIRDRLDKVEDRVTELEKWCTTANNEITSLKGLITALENNDYVTGVETLEDGYRITFSKSGSIIIRNGKDGVDGEDGKDGYTPIIGVAKYSDGLYYWTIQSEDGKTVWLTDADGNMIRTTGDNGKDGEDGNDGLTPHIGGNGNWWIGDIDTGVKAQGETGNDGLTPHIGDNGNWWIGTTDTGVKAKGETGNNGNNAPTPMIKTGAELGNGYTADAVYLSVDGGSTWSKISGDKGEQGIQGPIGPAGPSGAACGISRIEVKENKVVFVLGTGDAAEEFTLPLCTPILVINGSNEITDDHNTFSIESDIFKQSGLIIQTRVESRSADGTDIITRSSSDRWNIGTSMSDNRLEITVEPAKGTALNETAVLKVIVTSEDGQQLAYGQKVFTNEIFAGVLSAATSDEADEQLEKMGKKMDKNEAKDIKVINWPNSSLGQLINYINDDYLIGTLEIDVPDIKELPTRAFQDYTNIKVFKSEYCKLSNISDGQTFENSSVEEVYLPAADNLHQMEFKGCANLRKVYLPNVKTVEGGEVFNDCTSLEVLDLPNLTTFGSSGYAYFAGHCYLLKEVNMPNATSLPGSAFQECYSLTYLSLPEVTEMGTDVFWKCTHLASISLPKVTVLPLRTFAGCVSLNAEEGLEAVVEVGESAFSGCSTMRTATLKKVTKIGKSAFANCQSLTLLGLGCVSEVDYSAFNGVDTESCDLRFWGGQAPTAGNLDKSKREWCGKKWKSILVFN